MEGAQGKNPNLNLLVKIWLYFQKATCKKSGQILQDQNGWTQEDVFQSMPLWDWKPCHGFNQLPSCGQVSWRDFQELRCAIVSPFVISQQSQPNVLCFPNNGRSHWSLSYLTTRELLGSALVYIFKFKEKYSRLPISNPRGINRTGFWGLSFFKTASPHQMFSSKKVGAEWKIWI